MVFSGRAGGRATRVSYLPEAGVDGADKHAEGLARAATHGPEHLTQEGDEAKPALHVLLLKLFPHGEVLLRGHKRPSQPRRGQPALLWHLLSKGWLKTTGKPHALSKEGGGTLGWSVNAGDSLVGGKASTSGHSTSSSVPRLGGSSVLPHGPQC